MVCMGAFTAQFLMAHPRLWRTKHTSIVIAFTGLSSGGAKKNEGVHVSALGLFDVFFFSLLPRSSPRLGRRPCVGRELMPFWSLFSSVQLTRFSALLRLYLLSGLSSSFPPSSSSSSCVFHCRADNECRSACQRVFYAWGYNGAVRFPFHLLDISKHLMHCGLILPFF